VGIESIGDAFNPAEGTIQKTGHARFFVIQCFLRVEQLVLFYGLLCLV